MDRLAEVGMVVEEEVAQRTEKGFEWVQAEQVQLGEGVLQTESLCLSFEEQKEKLGTG